MGAFRPAYARYAARIRKTLYYQSFPSTDRPSFPVTNILVEKFGHECRQNGLERLNMRFASTVCYDACATPCSLILSLVYLDRLRTCNPEYLATAAPSRVFLIATMVASKFLYDDGGEDEVFNDEWAASAGLAVTDLNQDELDFLMAMDWNLFVDESTFAHVLECLEGQVAMREGDARGFLTYTDVTSLSKFLPGRFTSFLDLVSHVIAVCLMSYTAAILSAIGGVLLAQAVNHHLAASLANSWNNNSTTNIIADSDMACVRKQLMTERFHDTETYEVLPFLPLDLCESVFPDIPVTSGLPFSNRHSSIQSIITQSQIGQKIGIAGTARIQRRKRKLTRSSRSKSCLLWGLMFAWQHVNVSKNMAGYDGCPPVHSSLKSLALGGVAADQNFGGKMNSNKEFEMVDSVIIDRDEIYCEMFDNKDDCNDCNGLPFQSDCHDINSIGWTYPPLVWESAGLWWGGTLSLVTA